MDLAPSAYRRGGAPARSSKGQQPPAGRFGTRDNKALMTGHAGAVRRSVNHEKPNSTHFGKLAAAAVVVAGAAVWTSGSSESLIPPVAEKEKPESLIAAIPTDFYFNDYADALERIHVQDVPDAASLIETADELAIDTATQLSTGTDSIAADALSSTPNLTIEPEIASISFSSDAPAIIQKQDSAPSAATLNETTELLATYRNEKPRTRNITVASGDTLSGILNRNGLKVDQMHQLLSNDVIKEHLSNIAIGQELELTLDKNQEFEALTLRVNNNTRINIDRTSSGFDVVAVELLIEKQQAVTSGKINQSLYLAAEQANLKQSTIMELANIFQWELDFARDIRKGDKFSLVYDRLYREGEYIGDGDILAAEFIRGGKSYKAIQFTTSDGETAYYAPDGQSKRRTFMRHPVDIVRITSKFNPNRLHPVLHQIRAHRGVDYGSPHGSPIYATADGKVSFSGSKNAYGNTVVLKHGEKYSTLYAHMSRISSKSVIGKRVKQGDVIGYVGKTGRVTGTHLHYEFRVNGKQIDPLKVELPAAQPLASEYHDELSRKSTEMSVLLKGGFEDMDQQVAGAAVAMDSETTLKTSR